MSDLTASSATPDQRAQALELLRHESSELHSYVRHHFQLLIAWFTFFCTSNYVAIGWLAGILAGGQLVDKRVVLAVGALFMFQNALGMVATLRSRRYFAETRVRQEVILLAIRNVDHALARDLRHPLPYDLYARMIQLILMGLATFILLWATLMWFAHTASPAVK